MSIRTLSETLEAASWEKYTQGQITAVCSVYRAESRRCVQSQIIAVCTGPDHGGVYRAVCTRWYLLTVLSYFK